LRKTLHWKRNTRLITGKDFNSIAATQSQVKLSR